MIAACCRDVLAVTAVATHADEAAVVVVLAAAANIEARLLRETAVGATETSWRTRTSGEGRVGAEHGDTRAVLGTAEGDHVLADVRGDELATLGIGVGEDVLYKVVAKLVTGDVDKRHARAIRTSLTYDVEVAIEEVRTTDLEALFNDLGSKLIHAVLGGVAEDMVNGTIAVAKSAMLADVLDAPVAELTVSDNVNAGEDLVDARALVFINAVLEDVLNDKTTSLTKSHLVPHSAQSLVDVLHDLRRGATPTKLEELLPDVAGIAVDDRLRDATQQLMDHDGLVLLGHTVESLLDNMASESIHAEVQGVATDRLGDGHNLLRRAMLEAALHQEVAETVDHERVSLLDDGLDDFELLLRSADLELLLEEDGSLLIIAADNLVDYVTPITTHVTVEEATIVERLHSAHVVLTLLGRRLRRLRLRLLLLLSLPLARKVRRSGREPGTDRCLLRQLTRYGTLRTVDLVELSLGEVLIEWSDGWRDASVADRARKARGRTGVWSRRLTLVC